MMYIKKDNESALRYSKTRSFSITTLPKKKKAFGSSSFTKSSARHKTAISPAKPSCVSKRSVSLPTNLRKTTVKTRNLFWFIPNEHRRQQQQQQRRFQDQYSGRIQPFSRPKNAEYFQTDTTVCEKQLFAMNQEIPQRVALEWITTSSTHSLSDTSEEGEEDLYDNGGGDDDLEGPLFGLEFVDLQTETNTEN